MIEVAAALLSVLALIAIARRFGAERWLYAASLLALPSLYAGFALLAGEPAIAGAEMRAGLPYLIGAVVLVVASRRHPLAATTAVAALWLLHGGYDLLHPRLFANPGVPPWYPLYCASVDVALGLYLGWLALRLAQPRNGVTSK